ncbi:MAG: chromosome segregation protein SMC, partial [Planctomycetales bacterium]|nr:chromosome segregation protein SMC [Planctomycetales bacterium]
MLKALELYGFKSFADKTRFEFPDGITVVVGPNGSGKSNIVDAMKWVLGEQSAKSLRGSEMADVIFKGSGGKGRKPSNTAEATIIFENKDGILAIDSPEVHVTRRVYRSGEGEYLINGSACRLRDIKDLFRGTGVGTDAYSLIEQGKVDTLLQASTKERRAIFEEATGISRFKAKKVETQRRLDRVEQNLTRLSDIVEEVETRLRTVKNQASKARRYKDYTTRLQQLRTHVGLSDWRAFTEQLDAIQAELEEISSEHESCTQRLLDAETTLTDFDIGTQQLSDELRAAEQKISSVRQLIAVQQSTSDNHRKRISEYEHEIHRHRRQLTSMTSRAGDLGDQLGHVQTELGLARSNHETVAANLETRSSEASRLVEQLHRARTDIQTQDAELRTKLKTLADATQRLASTAVELQRCDEAIGHCDTELLQLANEIQAAETELSEFKQQDEALTTETNLAREALEAQRTNLRERTEQRDAMARTQVDLQKRYAVASERCNVLEDLETRREGLSSGVREVLTHAHDEAIGPFAEVKGMVADLIRVDVDYAAQIDAVLGDSTQYIVTTGTMLANAIATGQFRPDGRVGLISLESLEKLSHEADANAESEVGESEDAESWKLAKEPGVVGRAAEFVDADGPFELLATHLLRRTWCVDSLKDALRLWKGYPHHRFVTKHEDVIDYDGSVSAGPRQSGAGIVSRRSELRSLRVELVDLQESSEKADSDLEELQNACDECNRETDAAVKKADSLQSELTECKLRTRSAQERFDSLRQRQRTLQTQRDAARDRRLKSEQDRAK